MAGLSITFDVPSGLFSGVPEAVHAELSKAVRKTAFRVLADAKDEIQAGEKTGRIYHIGGETTVTFHAGESGDDGPGAAAEKMVTFHKGKEGIEHQASAPGEAPANLYGLLAKSGMVEVVSDLEADVVFSSEYAAAMEFGTVAVGGKIEPRPFLSPAMDAQREQFARDCAAALAEGLAQGAK